MGRRQREEGGAEKRRPEAALVALTVALLVGACDRAGGATPRQRLVTVDGAAIDVSVSAVAYDAINPDAAIYRFATSGGAAAQPEGVVRWGAPVDADGAAALLLTDGSRLVTDRQWAASGYVRLDADFARLHRKAGWVQVDRATTAALAFDAGAESVHPAPGGEDAVRLVDGDRLVGAATDVSRERLSLWVSGAEAPLDVPLARLSAVRLGGAVVEAPPTCCLVGLRDGSLLNASRVRVSEGVAELTTAAGLRLETPSVDIVFLQPLGGRVEYLSGREPDDYRHTPYFDLEWPFERDAAIGGGPLVARGKRSAKGIAVRSASRLVYRLDGRPLRFQCEAAIADNAAEIGSVVFRVYLVRGGEIEPAFNSEIVRGGDPPTPIDVDTAGAAALVLVADFADAGDAGDHALWIDARLVDVGS